MSEEQEVMVRLEKADDGWQAVISDSSLEPWEAKRGRIEELKMALMFGYAPSDLARGTQPAEFLDRNIGLEIGAAHALMNSESSSVQVARIGGPRGSDPEAALGEMAKEAKLHADESRAIQAKGLEYHGLITRRNVYQLWIHAAIAVGVWAIALIYALKGGM